MIDNNKIYSWPLVSVIVISYNQKKFISECINSILQQDYNNFEIIIADDCSKDGTDIILKNIKNNHPNKIKLIISDKNNGITKNSNLALDQCNGKYICFTGGDDVFMQSKITKQVEWMEEDTNRVMCGHDVIWIDKDSQNLNIKSSDLIKLEHGTGPAKIIKNGPPFASSSMLFKKDNIPNYGFDNFIKISSDWKLMIDLTYSQKSYGYIEGVYLKYRRHGDNITNKYKLRIALDLIIIFMRCIFQYKKKYFVEWLKCFYFRFTNYLIR